MASFYKLSKLFFGIRSRRVKLLSIAAAHLTGMRYIGVFVDPVMACNLRCKMCYFSDDAHAPKPVRPMAVDRIDALLSRAAKLQIGCGAEPTLYRHLPELIARARTAGVPYIELTTNGQLLTAESLGAMIEAGLGGMTLSVHGTTRSTYEHLMGRASFDKFLALIDILRLVKQQHPNFKLRVNYTFNNLNINELRDIWTLFDGVHIDVLQIRPIQQLGDTEYADFDLSRIITDYDTLIQPLADHCRMTGTMFVGPTRKNLAEVASEPSHLDQEIEDATYYYVSPDTCNKPGLDLAADTFSAYHRRRHTLAHLVKTAISPTKKADTHRRVTKKMNYKVD